MPEVKHSVRSVVTRTPDGREYVLVTLTISCPVCGEITMELPGHHLKAVVDLLRAQHLEFVHITSPERAAEEVKELTKMAEELLGSFPSETKH